MTAKISGVTFLDAQLRFTDTTAGFSQIILHGNLPQLTCSVTPFGTVVF